MVTGVSVPGQESPILSLARVRKALGRRVEPWYRAVTAILRRYAHKSSSALSTMMCFGLVAVLSYIGWTGIRDASVTPRVRSTMDGVTTRRVVTERIGKSVASTPAGAKAAGNAGEKSVKPDQPEQKEGGVAAVLGTITTVWTEQEIADAVAVCKASLQSPTIRFAATSPMRSGQCGSAAPIQMSAVGEPSVSLRPAVTTNCRLASALDTWVTTVLQPAAKEIMGSPVVGMTGTSSYVCRNRNGSADGPISEHAFANAFDVGSFQLADGRSVDVAVWGATVPKLAAAPNGTPQEKTVASAPKPLNPAAPVVLADIRLTFLKRIHHEACSVFGTVLGPEANDAHREHLHFDMKQRRGHAFCQ